MPIVDVQHFTNTKILFSIMHTKTSRMTIIYSRPFFITVALSLVVVAAVVA